MSLLRGYPNRQAISLIEVVVGIVLMGTLAATAIIAGSSHLRQLDASEKKLRAVAVLDHFMTEWSQLDFELSKAADVASSIGIAYSGPYPAGATTASRPRHSNVPATWQIELVTGATIPELRGLVCEVSVHDAKVSSRALTKAEVVLRDE